MPNLLVQTSCLLPRWRLSLDEDVSCKVLELRHLPATKVVQPCIVFLRYPTLVLHIGFSFGLALSCRVRRGLLSLLPHLLVVLIGFCIALRNHCHLIFALFHIRLVQVLCDEEAVVLRRCSCLRLWLAGVFVGRGHLLAVLRVLLFIRLVLQYGMVVLYRQRLTLEHGASLAPSIPNPTRSTGRWIRRSLLRTTGVENGCAGELTA